MNNNMAITVVPGLSLLLMWLAMMLAMMLPAAVPLARAYGATLAVRVGRARGHGLLALVAGYLALWSFFAVLAAGAQAGLTALGFMTYEGRLASQLASGVLLAATGLYQFTPWKEACIAPCRSPATFLGLHWRGGVRGALGMGALQGMYCIGCCWLLFAALFALGTMSIGWMMVLLAILLAERRPRLGPWVTWGAGLAATAYGLSLLMLR